MIAKYVVKTELAAGTPLTALPRLPKRERRRREKERRGRGKKRGQKEVGEA